MMTEPPHVMGLLTGIQTAGFLIVALFFLRFWGRTRDSLFLAFAAAFALLAIGQPIPLLLGLSSESQSSVYLIRAAAFGLIILAILRKNARKS